jgi:hypothetical protein
VVEHLRAEVLRVDAEVPQDEALEGEPEGLEVPQQSRRGGAERCRCEARVAEVALGRGTSA